MQDTKFGAGYGHSIIIGHNTITLAISSGFVLVDEPMVHLTIEQQELRTQFLIKLKDVDRLIDLCRDFKQRCENMRDVLNNPINRLRDLTSAGEHE